MLTFTVVTPGGLSAVAVWEDGELAGDPEIVDTVEAMVEVGAVVAHSPVGPWVEVSKADPRSILRGLEEWGTVKTAGTWPEPEDHEAADVDF